MTDRIAPLCTVIADDNQDQAESLAQLIIMWGHDAHVCLAPQETLDCCQRLLPDVVLLDIGFPLRTDGLRLARQIRELFGERPVTIIATTGFEDDETIEQAKEAGYDHFLIKPIDLKQLQELLKQIQSIPQGV